MYHVYNRGSRRGPIFRAAEDYRAFVRLAAEARARFAMRFLAYCLMPNHWHFLLWPRADGDLSNCFHWLTGTHGSKWRKLTDTVGEGAVYQARFGSGPINDHWHMRNVWLYIERNPLVAGLVDRAEDWPWSSASCWVKPDPDLTLDEGPVRRPDDWLNLVNEEREDVIVF